LRIRALSGLTILFVLGIIVILSSWFYRKTYEKLNFPIERIVLLNAAEDPHRQEGSEKPFEAGMNCLENQLSRYAEFGYFFYLDNLNRQLRPLLGYEWIGREVYNDKITLLLKERQAVFLSETEDGEKWLVTDQGQRFWRIHPEEEALYGDLPVFFWRHMGGASACDRAVPLLFFDLSKLHLFGECQREGFVYTKRCSLDCESMGEP